MFDALYVYRASRKSAADSANGVTRTMLSQPAVLMAAAMLLKSVSDSVNDHPEQVPAPQPSSKTSAIPEP